MGEARHTVSAFDDELAALRARILELGKRASEAAAGAVRALEDRDAEGAKALASADREIDRLAAEAESAAVNIIALRAPMADDLRVLVASIKIAALLERTADYAKNIARRTRRITADYPEELRGTIARMDEAARAMLVDAVRAYAEGDAALAHEVCRRDEAVDELYDELNQGLIAYMIDRPDCISQAAHLLFVGKHLERIGDQATNIAEMVTYAVTGAQPAARDTGDELMAA